MDQIRYRGYAQSNGFDPINVPDSTRRIAEHGARVIRGMEAERDQLRRNRDEYGAAVERKNAQEAQNRETNNQFKARNRERYQEAVLRNQQLEITNAQTNANNLEKNLAALSGLSTTISKRLLDWQEERKKADIEEGTMLYYQNGVPLDQVEQFNQQEAAFIKTRDATNFTALQLAKSGNPPELVEQLRGLSQWKRYGYMIGLAQGSAKEWEGYLNDKLNSDNETQINLGESTLTPAQAGQSNDPTVLGAVTNVLRRQFISERGLMGANPALLNKYLFPTMKEGEEAVLKRWNGEMNRRKATALADEEGGILAKGLTPGLAGQSFNTYVSNMASVINPKTGFANGFDGARDQALTIIRSLAKSGDIPSGVLEDIQGTPIPGGGQTWGDKFPQLFSGLDDEIRDGIQADVRRQEAEEDAVENDRTEQLVAYLTNKGGATEAEKTMIEETYLSRGKPVPDIIKGLITVEKKSDQDATTYIESQLASGRGITLDELRTNGYSPSIILKYKDRVKDYEDKILKNPNYKAQVNALNLMLETNILGSATDRRPHWTLPLAKAEAERLLQSEYLNLVQGGQMSQAQALDNAAKKVRVLIDEGKPRSGNPKGVGPFALEVDSANPEAAKPNGGFRKYMSGPSANVQEARNAFKRIENATTLNANAFKQTVLLSDADFRQLEILRSNPSASFPPSIVYMANKARLSPWDIADGQLSAARKPLLTRPPEVQWSDQIDPKLRQLLYVDPSSNRTNRAFAGTQWNAAKVPNNWGVHVERAAAKYGLDPALLAGLLAHESAGWKANAVSSSGAVGLGQIMDNTLAEAGMTAKDRLDPVKSIYGAAKVFSGRLAAVNGDLTLALRAYNMGLAGATRNPGGYRGDAESIQYPSKVLKAAAIYGYGYGQGSPFRRQDTMNPRLAYRIGSLGYGSTGPHLDVKPVMVGSTDGRSGRNLPAYKAGTLDPYVLVKINGKLVPISKGSTTTDNDAKHRARGSFGHDYAAPDGTEVYLRNGARVVGSYKGDQGTDHTIIELPDGRRFQFLHGKNA